MTYSLEDYEFFLKKSPNCNMIKNVAELKIDPYEIQKNDPILLDWVLSILSGPLDDNKQLFENYYNAYFYLKNNDLLKEYDYTNEINQFNNDLLNKLNDKKYYIPLDKLEEVISVITCKKQTSLQLAFIQFMNLVDEYYGIDHGDLYGKIEADYKKILSDHGIDYDKYSKISPKESVEAAKLAIFCQNCVRKNKIYKNFWHYLLERDFSGINNGSISYFDNSFDLGDEVYDETNIFHIIRKIIFKELSQYSQDILEADSIKCYVWW